MAYTSTNRFGGSNREKMLQTLNGTSQNDKNTDQIYQNLSKSLYYRPWSVNTDRLASTA